MSYIFNPKSDEELNSFDLLDPGVYDFSVLKSTRKVSKSGNSMAELQLNIWDKQGKEHFIFDYLVFSTANMCIKKISNFCKSTGLHEEYKKGELPEELDRYSGKLELGIQEGQPKPDGGFYPKKNIVVDYISTEKAPVKVNKSNDDFIDSDIPF